MRLLSITRSSWQKQHRLGTLHNFNIYIIYHIISCHIISWIFAYLCYTLPQSQSIILFIVGQITESPVDAEKKNDLRSGWVRSNPINLASQSISNVHDVHQMSIKCPSISRTVHTSTHQLPLKTSPRAILSREGLEKNASLEVKFAKESVRIAAEEMKVCSETYNAPSKLWWIWQLGGLILYI